MSSRLTVELLAVAIILALIVLLIVRRGRMPIKFAIIWFVPSIVLFILALLPQTFIYFAELLGFQTISNLIIGILFVLLFFIILALTVIIAGQTTKINLLIQEISMLQKKIGNNENDK